MGFPGGSVVKNLPAMQETQIPFLGWKDPLEKEMATHSNIPAWEIPWTEEPGKLPCMGGKESNRTEATEHAENTRKKDLQNNTLKATEIDLSYMLPSRPSKILTCLALC